MVQMVEGIIDKLSDKWDQQETEHNARIDLLIELQCDRVANGEGYTGLQKRTCGTEVQSFR